MAPEERPTVEEIELVARFNYERSGPIPSPMLLAKFKRDEDYTALGRRLWELLYHPGED